MIFLSKKGSEVQINWLIGLLSGVLVSGVILAIGLQWYATTTKTEDSFDALTAKIESLKDGEKTSLAYFLPDGYLLVSFAGKDFVAEDLASATLHGESCDGTVQIPDICGAEDCLCVCDGSYKSGYEDACIKDPLACYPLTSEATKSLTLFDSDCSAGVYREGPGNGIFSLFLQREGNTIKFCTEESCVAEKYREIVASFKEYVENTGSCTLADACTCSADPSFLEGKYALIFTPTEIELWDITEKIQVYALPTTTKIKVKQDERLTDFVLYTMDVADGPNVVGVSSKEYWILSPTIEDIQLSAYESTFDQTFSMTHLKVEELPRKEGDALFFIPEGTEICTETDSSLFA